jgi:hypothetical protein
MYSPPLFDELLGSSVDRALGTVVNQYLDLGFQNIIFKLEIPIPEELLTINKIYFEMFLTQLKMHDH